MIKIFRRIRHTLIKEGKTITYFKYAVGEIFLVVVGILIALYINNWNEERKDRIEESELLQQLHNEFLYNKRQFQNTVSGDRLIIKGCEKIIAMFPISLGSTPLDSLEEYGNYSLYNFTFNPSQGTINSIINTSSFSLIQNDTLRNQLILWQDLVEDYKEDEIDANRFLNDYYFPYAVEHFSLGNFSDPRVNFSEMKTLKFENMIRRRKSTIDSFFQNGKVRRITQVIDEIIRLSAPAN